MTDFPASYPALHAPANVTARSAHDERRKGYQVLPGA